MQTKGYSAWLDEQMSRPSHISGWRWLESQGHKRFGIRFNQHYTDHMMWNQLIAAHDAVRKRVALALSEIFVVSTSSIEGAWPSFAMAAYWDLLNTHAFGNYRALLEAITLNPAMGAYLNTRGNKKANDKGRVPDENYAREVMQLFSIGLYELNTNGTLRDNPPRETYAQAEVTNLARIFTGWDVAGTWQTRDTDPTAFGQPMVLNANEHATEPATFLGQTVSGTDGKSRLTQALDIIASHRNVAPFISHQLIQRLVTSAPSAAYVGRVAAVFNSTRGDLGAVTKAVLLDPEARQDASLKPPTWGKLREPMIRFVQWARTFNAAASDARWIIWDLSNASNALGQSPLRSPSVFNFFRPGYVPPGTALAQTGQAAPEFQITNENSVAGYINFIRDRIGWGYNGGKADGTVDFKLVANYAREMGLANDPAALVARLNLLLTGNQLTSATVTLIRDAITSINPSNDDRRKDRVGAAILMVMASPEYLVQK